MDTVREEMVVAASNVAQGKGTQDFFCVLKDKRGRKMLVKNQVGVEIEKGIELCKGCKRRELKDWNKQKS